MTESIPFSGTATPKRKRAQILAEEFVIPPNSTTEATGDGDKDDGSYSPRTRVTHRFQNLTLRHGQANGDREGGDKKGSAKPLLAVVPALMPQYDGSDDAMDQDAEAQTGSRKRFRALEPQPEKDQSLRVGEETCTEVRSSVALAVEQPDAPRRKSTSPTKSKQKPSLTPPTSVKSSPIPLPPSTSSSPSLSRTSSPDLRAALTWQEEEITIYDPDDSDDDGTGLNGIGFKPTAAVTYARGMKRKQQLAEYRKREEREARARRNMRRAKGSTPSPVVKGGKERDKDKEAEKKIKERRVRFLEEAGVLGKVGDREVAKEAMKAVQ